MQATTQEIHLTLIYGKGLHSASQEMRPLKQAVKRALDELGNSVVYCQEEELNAGRLNIILQPKLNNNNAALSSNSLFSAQTNTRSKLKADAKPFVPGKGSFNSHG